MQYTLLNEIYEEVDQNSKKNNAFMFNLVLKKIDELIKGISEDAFFEIEDELYLNIDKIERLSFKNGFRAALDMFRESGLMQEYDPHTADGWTKFVLEANVKLYISKTGYLPESLEQLEKWNESNHRKSSKAYVSK